MTMSAFENPNLRINLPLQGMLAERLDGLRRKLTLRFALLALVSVFGLGLVALVAANGASHLRDLQSYRGERDIDLTRQAIRSAFIELETASRRLGYDALDPSGSGDALVPLEIARDRITAARDLSLDRGDPETAARLAAQASAADAILQHLTGAAGLADAGRAAIHGELAGMAAELADLRRGTVGTLHIADVQMALLHLVRDQTIAQHRDLDITTEIVFAMLSDPSGLSPDARDQLDAALIRLQAPPVALLAADDALVLPARALRSLAETIREGIVPGLAAVTGRISADTVDPDSIASWIAEVERVDAEVRQVLAETDRIALSHIDARIDVTRRDMVIATIGGGLLLLAYVQSLVMIMRRLITPMNRLRKTLMRLAEGDLRPIEASDSPFADVQAVVDALRVFRTDAIRRERLRQERLELMAELTAANREMRADLEAAAALQVAQLPRPGTIGGVRFGSHFRASRHLGGDSFDYFRLPDGTVAMFQLDVAGHGTASSLVAVAAHTSIKRTMHDLSDGRSLADVLDHVNANWQDDLPYFTALLIRFDPASGTGTMVQAGHPYPLLLPASGEPRRVGEGGLPVGVHPDPGYREQTVALDPGDRLFVFSDGIYEVRNSAGDLFGEDRLIAEIGGACDLPADAIVERIMATLRIWAGTTELDDDISLVVMERQS